MLRGLRILELSGGLGAVPQAGPLAVSLGGRTLARLGAEVIRVDPVGGVPPSWPELNRGKLSIMVDPRSAAGHELVVRLAAQTGVVLADTSRPGHAELSARRPGLIHVLVEDGPAGLPETGTSHGRDAAYGLYAAVAILAADRHRLVTGQGSAIRVTASDLASATGIRPPGTDEAGRHVPVPGGDAVAVLGRLGLGAEEIAGLRGGGIIG